MRVSFQSTASRSGNYRSDIDGLRAVAVLAVVFFHEGFSAFRGGFAGVDVFYVISGYLITALLARDCAAGKFSLISFYERRMRRIFPALFALLFFSVAAACVLFNPREMASFGKTLMATTFFASNLYFWRTARPLGYLDDTGDTQVLLHTWSLSVEEQFYLVFPVALFLLFRWARGKVTHCLIFLLIISFLLNLWATQYKPIAAFYWFIPRAWELLMGAVLAMGAVPRLRTRLAREVAGFLGLAMIVGAFCTPMAQMSFPGAIVLLPCVGTALVIHAGDGAPSSARTILSFRPLVFVGVISYSPYLWHWPIIVISKHLPFVVPPVYEIATVLGSSVAIAFLSFEIIEKPFRGGGSAFNRRQIFALGAAASITSVAIGASAYLSHGLPVRYDATTRQLIASNLDRQDDYDESSANWRTEVHSIADIHFCSAGIQSASKVMFWRDSQVEQLFPAIRKLSEDGDLGNQGVLMAIENACLPAEHLNTIGPGYHCDSFAKFAMLRAEHEDIGTVFLGFGTWWSFGGDAMCRSVDGVCTEKLSRDDLVRRLLDELADKVRTLRGMGKRVIVCLPFPIFNEPIPELEIRNAIFGKLGFAQSAVELSTPALQEEIKAMAVSNGAEIFDPRMSLCDGAACITQINGVSIYKDESHLAASQVSILEDSLRQALLEFRRGQGNTVVRAPAVKGESEAAGLAAGR